MEKVRVLLDTNILISGLVFTRGNEHQILQLIENRTIKLLLPESVLIEARKVLIKRFPGFEQLLDIFLGRIEFEIAPLSRILSLVENSGKKVRDVKDAPIYAAIALTRPDYAVTGDRNLRQDLQRSSEITSNTKICSSKELLEELRLRNPSNTSGPNTQSKK